MPSRVTRREEGEWVDLHPLGSGGLDYQSNKATARPDTFVAGEGIRLDTNSLDRRKGEAKIYRASDPNASKTCGTDAKYVTIPAASHLQLKAGGFAFMAHFKAVRPSGGNTAYILSSRVDTQAYHILEVTLSDAGVITVSWTKNSDQSSVSVACDAVAASATVHLLAVFDAPEGTFTVYIDGASSGTPVTGIAVTELPVVAPATAWHMGVHYNPATTSVVANTHFDGAFQGFTLLTLRGITPSDGVTSFVSMLRKHSLRLWPAPHADYVVFCYDMIDSGLTLYDRSRYENAATATSGTTDTSAVANSVIITNHVGHVQRPDNTRTNVLGSAGRLFYENVA